MKPLLKLIVVILALIAFVSCQGEENESGLTETPNEASSKETNSSEEVEQSIGFVPADDGPRCVSDLEFFLIGWAAPGVLKWSYDGSYLAIQKDVGRISPIYIIETADIDTWSPSHQPEIIAVFEGTELNWSPVDNQLAFVNYRTLFLASVERPEPIALDHRLTPLTTPYFISGGNEIAFSAWGDDGWGIDGITIESGERRRISRKVNNRYWSLAAQMLVYEFADDEDDDTEIVVRNLNHDRGLFLTENSFCDVSPVWSPDGERIAFVSGRTSDQTYMFTNRDIFIVNIDDGSESQITNGETVNVQPSWSPNGQQIVFVKYDLPGDPPNEVPFAEIGDQPYWGEQDLFKYDFGEGRLVRLTSTTDAAEWLPAWSPAGDYIAYFSFDTSNGYLMETSSWELKVTRADGRGEPISIDIK